MSTTIVNSCLLPQRRVSSLLTPFPRRDSASPLSASHRPTRIPSKPTRRSFVLVKGVLEKARPTSAASSDDVKNVDVEIYSHRTIKAGIFKDVRPHVTLQLVSEDPNVPPSKKFSSDTWKGEDWVRGHGVEDPGSVWSSTIQLPLNFGTPGALLVTNEDSGADGRVYISTVKVGDITFHAHSTVDKAQGERVFFSSDAKLPQDTPAGIKELRKNELLSLQGRDSSGNFIPSIDKERHVPERIYQYDVYNDLSNPQKSKDLERPTLGGSSEFPFPRRLRTNRGLIDGGFEKLPPRNILGVPDSLPYLPLDDQFNETKTFGFVGDEISAALAEVPAVIAQQYHDKGEKQAFRSLHAVDASFTEPTDDDTAGGQAAASPMKLALFKQALNMFKFHISKLDDKVDQFWQSRKFPLPKVRKNRQLDWATDEEFGRQFLAGQNPVVVQQATKQWLDKTPFTDDTIKGLLDGKKLSERVKEGARLFCVDYVPGFEDYIERINGQKKKQGETNVSWLLKDRFQHAGRALFYFNDNGYMQPVGIEIRKEQGKNGTVYTPYDPKELWQLAKNVIASLDSAYHQVVSHYLRAHACQEPFILATLRNISALHPVYKLMLPHFRYTLDINANARSILVNADGLLEQTFTTGRYTMEIGSWAYKNYWQFNTQGLENDLIARGMVQLENGKPKRAQGKLVPVVDYPYAQDGLDIYYSMRTWFGQYLSIYYDDKKKGKQVTDDPEIQAWWKDIKENGHPDKKEGWPELKTVADLTDILTTIAYNGSAHHAAVNFGQYDYSGYVPNRPSFIRKPIPEKDSAGVKALQANYEEELLSYLNSPADATQLILLYNVLSAHAPNEEYLDEEIPEWIQDPKALEAHKTFIAALKELDDKITERNSGDSKIRSVKGARGLEYTLLRPHSTEGVTMRGVPCSTSI